MVERATFSGPQKSLKQRENPQIANKVPIMNEISERCLDISELFANSSQAVCKKKTEINENRLKPKCSLIMNKIIQIYR